MGCQAMALITKGYLCCPGKVVNKIVTPINVCIKTKDFMLNLDKPLNTNLFISLTPNVCIAPKITNPKISIKNITNVKLNIRKCKES